MTEATIAAMTEIAAMIGRMDTIASAMASAVEQQSVTTREIATKVTAVSGATDLVQRAKAMGAVATLPKPLNVDVLIDVVRRYCA